MAYLDYLKQQIGPHVSPARKKAFEAFATKGFPNTHDEKWKYTDLRPLRDQVFSRSGTSHVSATPLPSLDAYSKSFAAILNGALHTNACPENISPWNDSVPTTHASSSALAELNQAFCTAGLNLHIQSSPQEPITLWNLSRQVSGQAFYTQHNISLAANTQACVIEVFDGQASSGQANYNNHITSVDLKDHAHLTHITIDRSASTDLSTRRVHAQVGAHGHYKHILVTLDGSLSRFDFVTHLLQQGAQCSSQVLALPQLQQHVDFTSDIYHEASHTQSQQLVKSAVSGAARSVFSGTIHVFKDAQKIEAHQLNRNLLLSSQSKADSLPRLEIFADDVQCSHGSSTGKIDENELFYLRSRGYSKQQAIATLVEAFGREILEHIPVEHLRAELTHTLEQRITAL